MRGREQDKRERGRGVEKVREGGGERDSKREG